MSGERRRLFLSEIMESILSPYEASTVYEEEVVGEFENELEVEFFNNFIKKVGKGRVVLDLACGDGRHTLKLSENAGCVVALDLSLNMLRMARDKCSPSLNISFVRGSMFNLPFREEAFDGVWFSQAFEYAPPDRRVELLTELRGVLREEGVLYMSVETWMYPSLWKSLRGLLGDFKLYFYWKFIKRKPLMWGEFLYYLTGEGGGGYRGWHYHVHTSRWALTRLLEACRFKVLNLSLRDGYIYVLCIPTKQSSQE